MEKVIENITLYCDSCPFTENQIIYFITTFQSASIGKNIFPKYSMCNIHYTNKVKPNYKI